VTPASPKKRQRAANARLRDLSNIPQMSAADLLARRADLGSFRHVLGAAASEIGQHIEILTAEIKSRERKRFAVTDHAVIQYLRRVMGYDTEAVRNKIATLLEDGVPRAHLKSDARAYEADGVIFVIARKGVVVTAYPVGEVEAIAPAVVDGATEIQGDGE
jgi:hypothetical protein